MDAHSLATNLVAFGDDGVQLQALDTLNRALSMGSQLDLRISLYLPALLRVVAEGGNSEIVLLAIRCVNQIIDIEPRAGASVLSEGGHVTLCAKLLAMQDLDVAEQCVACLQALATGNPREIFKAGGMRACTAFYDFFPAHLQRRALETVALMCNDAARLPEDAALVGDVIKTLSPCLDDDDGRISKLACKSLAKLITCYANPPSAPSGESARALKALAASPVAASSDLPLIAPLRSAMDLVTRRDWRRDMIAKIGSQATVKRFLRVIERGGAGDDLLEALAYVAAASPSVIPVLLERGVLTAVAQRLDGNNAAELSLALRLVDAMLPPLSPTDAFLALDADAHNRACDEDAVPRPSATPMLEDSPRMDQVESLPAVGGGADGAEEFWPCPMCTFVNEPSAIACEICGNVCPAIAHRAAAPPIERQPSPLDEGNLVTVEDVYAKRPHMILSVHRALGDRLASIATSAASSSDRARALQCLASLLFHVPRADLAAFVAKPTGYITAGLHAQSPRVVVRVLQVALVVLWRLGATAAELFARQGVPQLVRRLGPRFEDASRARVKQLRQRASALLDLHERLLPDSGPSKSQRDKSRLADLAHALARLSAKDAVAAATALDPPESPRRKKFRVSSPVAPSLAMQQHQRQQQPQPQAQPADEQDAPLHAVLRELDALLAQGLSIHEYTTSGLAQAIEARASDAAFARAARETLSETSVHALLRIAHETLDTSELFLVSRHGATPKDGLRALKASLCLTLKPTAKSLVHLRSAAGHNTQDDFSIALFVDPLASVRDVEAAVWQRWRRKLAEERERASARLAAAAAPLVVPAAAASAVAAAPIAGVPMTPVAPLTAAPAAADNEDAFANDPVHEFEVLAGMRVVRGRDWKWGEQDGGPGNWGTVTDVKNWNGKPNSGVCVTWDVHQGKNVYRFNAEDKFDLALAPLGPFKAVPLSGLCSAGMPQPSSAWRAALKRGDKVEAMDLFKRWYPATVRYVSASEPGAVRVAFEGWSARFDEWIPLSSPRLAEPGTRVDAFAGKTDDVPLDVAAEFGFSAPELRMLPSSRRATTSSGLAVHAHASVRVRRDEGEWVDATVLGLCASAEHFDESKVDDDALQPDAVLVRVSRDGGAGDGDGGNPGNDTNDDDDEFDDEWLPLTSDALGPPLPPSAMAQPKRFCKCSLLGREVWLPCVVERMEDDVTAVVRLDCRKDATHVLPLSALLAKPPRTGFAPSATDLTALDSAAAEFGITGDNLVDVVTAAANEHRLAALGSSSLSTAAAAAAAATTTSAAAAMFALSASLRRLSEPDDRAEADDWLDDDGVHLGRLCLSSGTSAAAAEDASSMRLRAALLASSRPPMLLRSYSAIDVAEVGGGQSSTRAASVQQSAAAQPQDVPVSLFGPGNRDGTIFCALHNAGGLEAPSSPAAVFMAVDASSAAWKAATKRPRAGELVELSGTLGIGGEGGVLSCQSNFLTVVPRGVQFSKGSMYYEVLVVQPGLAQLGWIDAHAVADDASGKGCGDDEHGWAFDGKRCFRWHGSPEPWGSSWSANDVVGCLARFSEDGKRATFSFSLNGSFAEPMGDAFADVAVEGPLRPAVTFNKTMTCAVRLVKSQCAFAPPDCTCPCPELAAADDVAMADDATGGADADVPLAQAVDADETVLAPIRLLQFIHGLSVLGGGDTVYVNRRLSNMLASALGDALTVCSGALPAWCRSVASAFPLVFPLEARLELFKALAFGVSRSMYRFHEAVEGSAATVALRRQKAVLPRDRALDSAVVLMPKLTKAVLVVDFADEIGHGLGPTLEFYSLVCLEVSLASAGMWRFPGHVLASKPAAVPPTERRTVTRREGLFPAVLSATTPADVRAAVLARFEFLGHFIAKALVDDRMLDLDLSEVLLRKLVSGPDDDDDDLGGGGGALSAMVDLVLVDSEFAQSLEDEDGLLGLDFCLPGTDVALNRRLGSGGGDEDEGDDDVVTPDNVHDYVDAVAQTICCKGVRAQIQAMRAGVSRVFDIKTLGVLTPGEFRSLLRGVDAPWVPDVIAKHLVLRDYSSQSPQIGFFLQVLGELDATGRRDFLRFCTGSPRLPVGGWASFKPKMTIARKDAANPDQVLPSCSTCLLIFKLPQYSSLAVLRERVLTAISEGQNFFSMD